MAKVQGFVGVRKQGGLAFVLVGVKLKIPTFPTRLHTSCCMKHQYLLLALLLAPGLSAQTPSVPASFDASTARHRAEYKAHFLQDPRSPLTAADTVNLDFFPPNTAWSILARFERTPLAQAFEMPTYSGQKRDYIQFGELSFEYGGQRYSLQVYQNLRLVKDSAYQDHLFLPFKDWSNGETSYGGGRYMDLSQRDIQDGMLLLDFNKCYNPWCAYSDGFNCPIPPAPNHLEVAVEAGERNYRGERKH